MELCWDTRRVPDVSGAQQTTTIRTRKVRDKNSSLTAENIEEHFYYLRDRRVLICREHATGIQNLDTHLRNYHAVSVKERRAIVENYSWWWIKKPDEVQLPPPMGPPFKVLGKPLNGFQCAEEDCDYITINSDIMRMHCKKEHGLPWKGDTSKLFTKAKVQTFFRTGGLQRYFIVHAPEDDQDIISSDQKAKVDALLSEWRSTQKEHEKEMQVMDAEAAKTDRTGWFNRTGWLSHLAKRNRVHLAHAIRLPDKDEPKLRQAAKVVELLVERGVRGLSTLARETRRWLRSAQREEIDQRPIARLQNPESQARYAGYIVMFVCYFLRIIADEGARGDNSDGGSSSDESDGESSGNNDESIGSGSDGESIGSESDRESIGSGSDGESIGSGSGGESIGSESDRESSGSRSDRESSGSRSGSDRRNRRREEQDLLKDARELLVWQGRQKELAKELWRVLDGNDENAQIEAMLQVLASFIFISTGNNPFSSGLIHFLAALGIDATMDRLRTAKNYSYMLAGVVYCTRVIATEALLPAAKRDEQGDAEREEFLRKRKDFLSDGSFSPMSEMLSLLAYGKFVALNAGNSGNAYWSRDKMTFYLNGRPIVISRFQQMARDMVTEAEDMLWQELFWVADRALRFTVPLGKIVDDVTFTKRGISFVSRTGNGLADGLEWMLQRVMQTKEGQKLRTSDGEWNVKQVKRYLRRTDCFLELLLAGVHITSGQPGRGTEITTMRHRNGVLQDRNIFVMDGQVMTVVRYHKSQSQWDKPKVVPRFLPWRLGQVMALHLAYLQPFAEYLAVQVLGGAFSDYVWADDHGPWQTDRMTRILKRETGKRLATTLTTLDYRHVSVGIGRVVVGEAFGHGYQDEVGEIEEAEVDEDGESALELQSARTTKMGVGNYSVPADIIKHLSVRSIETFRPLSELWHRFLGLGSSRLEEEKGVENSCGRIGKASRKHGLEDGTGQPWAAPRTKRVEKQDDREEQLHKAMQQALSRLEVSFKSFEQERAIRAVIDRQTPLVVVLPTGGGKSLLFMVPACLSDPGVTIVVVPYRALVDNLVERIKDAGIDCFEWKHGQTNPAAVVVISADVAAEPDFLRYAMLLSGEKLLRRVVIDECHLIFTSSDWRPKLAQLRNLRVLACPIVLLTATLPPVLEEELGESMLVRCATYVRASTVRPNIRYIVSWCERGKAQETALAICRRQQRWLTDGRKGVVYCCSKPQCEEIADELDCAYYHAGVVDRAERLNEWLAKGGLIVATSALGTGVDFPGIIFVLHVGMPWSMIDYAQESGRGGRAGEAVDSVIVVEDGEVEVKLRKNSGSVDVCAMGLFLQTSECRRGVMSGYLDGRMVNCSDIDSAGCDRCGEGLVEWQESHSRAAKEWEQVRGVMDELADTCPICWVMGDAELAVNVGEAHLHPLASCRRRYQGLSQGELDGFRQQIRYGLESHSCMKCGVSQKFCETGQETTKRCQWPNVLVPVVRAAVGFKEGIEIIEGVGYSGELSGDFKDYANWLGKRYIRRVWGEIFSNAMVVAIRVILYCSRGI